jgi:hypothetical protein
MSSAINIGIALVAELVYALRLGRSPARVRGSSPLEGTEEKALQTVTLCDPQVKEKYVGPRKAAVFLFS